MEMSVQGNTRRRKCRRRHAKGDMCALPEKLTHLQGPQSLTPANDLQTTELWRYSGMVTSASAKAIPTSN